ncbi:uncharacterized protein LOC134210221 [Armigeres subalbatus]|uniref:uncharacterized protein LOC134210221 n=1 Tax=Armigeres subalbatus TaxID=124917 RepID=UPI002ED686D1
MQKRFIEDKYKLLESQLELDEENVSVRSKSSRVSKRSKIAKVVQWVNNCAEQSETPPEKSTEARLSTMPPASSNRTAPATTTAIAPGVQNLMQPPSSSLLSPLKHPALSNQRSATIQKISMQVPEDSKTIPKQDKTRTGVFNKITGTVPLAQSTPTQTQSSALLLACSDTRNPQTTSVAHPPESSSGMPENQPISALASMPPVLVSSAPPPSAPIPPLLLPPLSAPEDTSNGTSVLPLQSAHKPTVLPPPPCAPALGYTTLPPPPGMSLPFAASAAPLPGTSSVHPGPASVSQSALPNWSEPVSGFVPAALPTAFSEPPGKSDSNPLPPMQNDSNLQHLMKQFGSIALSPLQSPLLNANIATFAPSPHN